MHIANAEKFCDFIFVELAWPHYVFNQQHCSKYVDSEGIELKSPDNAITTLY